MNRFTCRPGITLIELMVTLLILGTVAGVVGIVFNSTSTSVPDTPAMEIGAARREAIITRRVVTVTIYQNGMSYSATAFPDGTVIADPVFEIYRIGGGTHE